MANKNSLVECEFKVKKHGSIIRRSSAKVELIPSDYRTKKALRNLESDPNGKIMLDELKHFIEKKSK